MNIKFNHIIIHQFLSSSHMEVDLSEQGQVLVKGFNYETNPPQSNGSGKSLIFDAILWTLAGETSRGADSVVNEKSDEGCYCILTFECNDDTYEVLRAKSSKEFGNLCRVTVNGDIITDQIKKSQEYLNQKIMMMTPEVLGSIIVLSQGLPYKFTGMTPSKRKDLLEVMSGSSDRISKIKMSLDQESSAQSQNKQELSNQVNHFLGEISGLSSLQKELKSQIDSQVTKEECSQMIENLKNQITDYQDQITRIKESLIKEDQVKEDLWKVRDNVNSHLTSQKTLVKNLEDQLKSGICPTCKRPYDNLTDIDREKIKSDIESARSLCDALNAKLTGITNLVRTHADSYQTMTNQITSLMFSIKENKNHIEELDKYLEDFDKVKDKYTEVESQLKDKNILINQNKTKIEEIVKYENHLDYIKRELSRDFKGYILQESIDYLSSRAEYYGSLLFNTDKRLSIKLSGNKILVLLDSRPYENLSGGERQRVDIAVQLSMRDMLQTSSGFYCNLLVLDEIFDNLDSSGSESLIRLISSELSDIDTVFVVTHHSEIDIPYDKILTVIKDSNGISSLGEEE